MLSVEWRAVHMLSADLIALLRCPENGLPLRVATTEELVRAQLAEGLAREDGLVVYPIRDGIPMLLIDEAVRITPLRS